MKRIEWLDISKYFFIMVVILEHLEAGADELSCLVVPFALPGFLFASGYTHKAGQKFKSFASKKIRTLFVPWFILSIFDICLSNLVSFGEHSGFLYELGWNMLQIRGKHDQLWFVAALFTAYFPFYFFIEWYNRKSAKNTHRTELFLGLSLVIFSLGITYSRYMNPALLPWGTSSLPWHIDYAFRAIFFMTCGYMFKEKYERTYDTLNKYSRAFFFVILHTIIVYAPYFVEIPSGIFSFLANLVTPVLGVFAIISISKLIRANKYLLYVGQNTLLYFAFHGKVYGAIEGVLRLFFGGLYSDILASKASSIIFAILFTIIVSLILIIPSYIVNRWFPFILGKKKQNSAA